MPHPAASGGAAQASTLSVGSSSKMHSKSIRGYCGFPALQRISPGWQPRWQGRKWLLAPASPVVMCVRPNLKCPVLANLKCPLLSSGRKAGQGSDDPIQREGSATGRRPQSRCRTWLRWVRDAANLAAGRRGFQRSGLRPQRCLLPGSLAPAPSKVFLRHGPDPMEGRAAASRGSRVLA